MIKPRDIEVLHETPFTVHTKTALRVKLISTSLLYDMPMNLRTKFPVANSVTDLRVCANFDGNLNACKLVRKRVANFNLANLMFARRQTMGKFARQICNKFTGVQILCKLDGNLHACKSICKFMANLTLQI